MKVLLDENLPHDLRHFIPGHDVATVAYMRWKGVRNGALLRRAADAAFDVLLTIDGSIAYQQNPDALPIAVLIVSAPTNALDDLRPCVPAILGALEALQQPRTLVRIP